MSRRMPVGFSFIFYLACALESDSNDQVATDLRAFLEILHADDLSYCTTSKNHREMIMQEVPPKLERYNLQVNTTKTEEGEAPDRSPLHLPLNPH